MGPGFIRRENKIKGAGQWAVVPGWASVGWAGAYLLSRFRSIIGAPGFNFSVRNGKRWSPRAVAALMPFAVVSVCVAGAAAASACADFHDGA